MKPSQAADCCLPRSRFWNLTHLRPPSLGPTPVLEALRRSSALPVPDPDNGNSTPEHSFPHPPLPLLPISLPVSHISHLLTTHPHLLQSCSHENACKTGSLLESAHRLRGQWSGPDSLPENNRYLVQCHPKLGHSSELVLCPPIAPVPSFNFHAPHTSTSSTLCRWFIADGAPASAA